MAKATLPVTITRSADTQVKADKKLEQSHIDFVTYRVTDVRQARPVFGAPNPDAPKWGASEYDFYEREAETGDILQTAQGKDRINNNKLDKAVERILREFYNEVRRAAIKARHNAASVAAAQTEIAEDTE